MPPFVTNERPPPAAALALLLFVSLAACSDELSAPDVQSCDLTLPVPVTQPAAVEYSVDAGNATVASVTFTSTAGDSTLTSFPGQSGSTFTFDRTVVFPEATNATLQATGEVGTGGAIVVSYNVIPTDGSTISQNAAACQG